MARPATFEELGFAQRQRLQYIESVVCWEGSVRRQRVSKLFGVTANHITTDFRRYKKICQGNIRYDEESRTYRPGRNFRPRISSGSPEEYLALLRTYVESRSVAVLPAIGGELAAATLPTPGWRIDRDALRNITLALKAGTGLEVLYQSLRKPDPEPRLIWPHTLVYAGPRWHLRAYDRQRETFRDFVLQRLTSVKPKDEAPPVPASKDVNWVTELTLEVVPNPVLSEHQRAVIGNEYGMDRNGKRWVWPVKLRRCLVPYFIHWNRLDLANPKAPIVLDNPEKYKDMQFGRDES